MVASNKDRLDLLEVRLSNVQEELVKMHIEANDKFAHIEASLKQFIETMMTEAMFQSKFTTLEFPKFSRGDPTIWLSKANQFFAYQDIPEDHLRVQYASYHLEDEAYQWWEAMTKKIKEDNTVITWNVFEGEMLDRFGPTEDFDEALCKIKQMGSLQDYLREFERLVNRVTGWRQKALVGTFMGGLHTSISDSIRMFRPQSLKGVITLARMRDEQLQKAKKRSANNQNY